MIFGSPKTPKVSKVSKVKSIRRNFEEKSLMLNDIETEKPVNSPGLLRLMQQNDRKVSDIFKKKQTKNSLKKLKKEGIDAHGRVCHVGNRENRQGFLKWVADKFGHIDILSYNAGCGFYVGNFLDQDEKGYDKMFDVNVKALYMFCKEAAPLM